jgi:hypothetical protein
VSGSLDGGYLQKIARLLVGGRHGLHFPAEFLIVDANLAPKCLPLARVPFQRLVKQMTSKYPFSVRVSRFSPGWRYLLLKAIQEVQMIFRKFADL